MRFYQYWPICTIIFCSCFWEDLATPPSPGKEDFLWDVLVSNVDFQMLFLFEVSVSRLCFLIKWWPPPRQESRPEHVKRSRVKTARFPNWFDCGHVWTASRMGLSSCGRVFFAPLAHVWWPKFHKILRSCATVQGRFKERLILELVARTWSFRGAFVAPNHRSQSIFSLLASFRGFFVGFLWTH